MSADALPKELGRYVLYDQIASGGMATVHFGRMRGAIGFSRLVAIKRLRPAYAGDPEFVRMFLDEARLAARLEHPNVVSTIDVVADETEVFIVMEHVLGETLDAVVRARRRIPPPIVSAIVCGILEGLHGAHEARGDADEPLEIVHRDVSPHNVIVGVDGVTRVFDFGVAKATSNQQETRAGIVKGKVTYMAPEQVRGTVDRRADLYATGIIMWELLVGQRRYAGEQNDALLVKLALNELEPAAPPSSLRCDVPASVDAVVARATQVDPDDRFETAREMAVALEAAIPPAPARDVARWLREIASERIEHVSSVMRRIERDLPSTPSLAASQAPSTGSVHVVTATIRPERTSSTVVPVEDAIAYVDAAAPAPRSGFVRSAALVVLAAAVLLGGARALVSPEAEPGVIATSAPPADAFPAQPVEIVSVPASEVAPVASPPTTPTPAPAAAPPERARAAARAAPAAAVQAARAAHVAAATAQRPPREAALAGAPARAESTTVATHRAGCESPFSIGADGIRQIKPECM